ncbi:MAG: acyl-CoA thioesterase [Fimbriimonadaceae bacterium]|nr:acyl-CoA thioesterase [Fimbriimonadaceae bacterium]
MTAQVSRERVRVRYAETDQMGHANYGSYLAWLEQARGTWCRDHGFSYRDLEAEGWRLPVVEVWVKYKGQIRYDDEIIVELWLEEMRRSALTLAYRILAPDGSVATEARTRHVWVDADIRARAIPDDYRSRIAARNPDA